MTSILRRRRFFPTVLAAALIVCFTCSEEAPSRTGAGPFTADLAALIQSPDKSLRAFEAETADVRLKITNKGKATWSSSGANPFFLSYHFLDEGGRVIRFENPRIPFPGKIRYNETVELTARIKALLEKGRYRLEFDVLQEGITWFKDKGSATLVIPLTVESRDWPEDKSVADLEPGPATKFRSGKPEFEKLGRLIRITLKHDEVNFRGKTGNVFGFFAGSGYPQIWLRDSRTVLPASRYYYQEPFLASWLVEHLAFQKENGSLEDWIDARGKSDKNTTETDQEASAVQSGREIMRLLGIDWLRKPIAGEPAISRLEKALEFIFKERFDAAAGLVKGAHTADWGDIDMEDADQQAVYTDSRTHWTADIYDQAMVYEACLSLAEMMESAGLKDKSYAWKDKAAALKNKSDARLWQEDKGFYRIHIHLTPLAHDFDEDDLFAMGGNAQAVISGLAGEKRARRIIEQALKRQKDFKISSVSAALLPPYPKGFFRHPMMDDPYEYQNGGQWDWFGGRLISAMFDHGFSVEAADKLLEIARKNVANLGLFEWDTPQGLGRGSDYFAGSAGALAGALYEGYFGIRLSKSRLSLEPRLGADAASVHVYLPASGLFAAYEYSYSPEEKKITFSFNSDFIGTGEVKILLPRDWNPAAVSPDSGSFPLEVRKDGLKTDFTVIRNHRDAYVVLKTDFKRHKMEIRNPINLTYS